MNLCPNARTSSLCTRAHAPSISAVVSGQAPPLPELRSVQLVQRQTKGWHERLQEVVQGRIVVPLELLQDRLLGLLELLVASLGLLDALQVGADLVRLLHQAPRIGVLLLEIGRASCRERV